MVPQAWYATLDTTGIWHTTIRYHTLADGNRPRCFVVEARQVFTGIGVDNNDVHKTVAAWERLSTLKPARTAVVENGGNKRETDGLDQAR